MSPAISAPPAGEALASPPAKKARKDKKKDKKAKADGGVRKAKKEQGSVAAPVATAASPSPGDVQPGAVAESGTR